jgi:hypothetical protein
MQFVRKKALYPSHSLKIGKAVERVAVSDEMDWSKSYIFLLSI